MTPAEQSEREVSDKLISIHAILLVARSVLDAMNSEESQVVPDEPAQGGQIAPSRRLQMVASSHC